MYFWARLLPTTLWPKSSRVRELRLARLKLTSSQLMHKLGSLPQDLDHSFAAKDAVIKNVMAEGT